MHSDSLTADFARYSTLCAHLIRAFLLRREADDDDLQAMIRAVHTDGTSMDRRFEMAGQQIAAAEQGSSEIADFALLAYSGQDNAERFIAPTAHQAALALIESVLGLMLPTRIEQYAEEFLLDEMENSIDAFLLDVDETQRLLARMQRERWVICPTEPTAHEDGEFTLTVEELSLATVGTDGLPRVSVNAIREKLRVMPGGRPRPRDDGPPAMYAYADWHAWWQGAGFKACPELPPEADAQRLVRVGFARLCAMLRGQ